MVVLCDEEDFTNTLPSTFDTVGVVKVYHTEGGKKKRKKFRSGRNNTTDQVEHGPYSLSDGPCVSVRGKIESLGTPWRYPHFGGRGKVCSGQTPPSKGLVCLSELYYRFITESPTVVGSLLDESEKRDPFQLSPVPR